MDTPFISDTVEYGEDHFQFARASRTVPQRISRDITDIGIKDGDILTLKVLGDARIGSSKFTLDLLHVDGGVDRVYRLQYVKQGNRFICRQFASRASESGSSHQKFRVCSLSAGGTIEIMVASSGYSVDFDSSPLQQFPHLIPLTAINWIEIEVRGAQALFDSFALTRRNEQQNTGGVIQQCYDKDQYCAVYIEEDPGACLSQQTSQWMQRNCPISCGTCDNS